MPKLLSGQKPYTYLVANLAGGSDPSRNSGGNPVKLRETYTRQHFSEIGRPGALGQVGDPSTPGLQTRLGLAEGESTFATAVVTVSDNTFSAGATLYLGEYELVSGDHFAVGGSTAATAANLEAAIDLLDGFSAAVVGSDVTITGPGGQTGNEIVLEAAYGGAVVNFTITAFSGGLPEIVGPELG